MNINDIHKFITFITDKEINGYNTPPEIDMALDRASMALFTERLAMYAMNQKAQDDLAPFKKRYVFTPGTTPGGIIQLPADYVHMLGFWLTSYDNARKQNNLIGVDLALDDEIVDRNRSQLRPVTVSSPFAQWVGKGAFKLYPSNATTGEVWYLKRPNVPYKAFTQIGRNTVYDPEHSVQLEWDEVNLNRVMFAAIANLGINMSNEQMVQYSELRKQDA